MEAGRARNRDDSPGLPTLSLGLSSVRHIVTKLEAEYARVVASDAFNREIVKYNPCGEDNDYYNYSFDTKVQVLNRFVFNLAVAFSRCIPSVTLANFGFIAVTSGLLAPRMISYLVVYPFCRLVFGTLYPAYASYKAVRTKNLKEYVKWMMYWIVFALFTCTETFTDVFLSWFPFYYEVKIVLVLWLLSPATKGSSILYRKFVHPALCRREQEIDEYIAKAKDQGYHTVLNLGTKGVNYATTVIMQTAIKGGGGLVQQLRKSYSLSDLSECEPREERGVDEADDVLAEPRLIRRAVKSGYATRRSASESNRSMYFPEVDVDVRGARVARGDEPDFSHIKSTEDISSGYSSAENSASLTRTSSVGGRSRARTSRTTITTIKRPQAAEDNQVIIEELHDDDSLDYDNMPPLVNFTSPIFLSHTNPPFLYQYVGDQVKIIQVLGSYPLSNDINNQNNNTDIRDQKEASVENISPQINICTVNTETSPTPNNVNKSTITNKDTDTDIPSEVMTYIKDNNIEHKAQIVQCTQEKIDDKLEENIIVNSVDCPDADTENDSNSEKFDDTISVNITYDKEILESDDEISFETPVSTPKSTRKFVKGKYGKDKAPLPPKGNEREESQLNLEQTIEEIVATENFKNITYAQPEKDADELKCESILESDPIKTNEIDDSAIETIIISQNENIFTDNAYEKNIRQQSKSPVRTLKSSALGKLLQLPGKFAFWHKHNDKVETDASSDASRRSSENTVHEFKSCPDSNQNDLPQIQMSEPTPTNEPPGNITKNILEKSDALQKAIEAKLEDHPEYKFVSLHADVRADVATTSKSTDV